MSRDEVTAAYKRHFPKRWPLRQVGGGPFQLKPGQPTDDTDMAMCIVRSYQECGAFDPTDIANRFVQWLNSHPPDVGNTTRDVLGCIRRGKRWNEAGRDLWRGSPQSLANGSLMRNGVVAGMAESLHEAWQMTLLHGMITHYAPLCQLCCAAQTWMLWQLLHASPPPSEWVPAFRSEFMQWLNDVKDLEILAWRKEVHDQLEPAWALLAKAEWDPSRFNPFTANLSQMGYVLLTLQIAWWALQWSLRDQPFTAPPNGLAPEVFAHTGQWVLSWVALIGKDSDTYGASAGPLIAAADKGLPSDLTDNLWVLKDL
jgi:ADP-ribosylglycohydrolase